MKVIKAEVMGVCEGVNLAFSKLKHEINNSPRPIYLLGNLVHNDLLMNSLINEGIIILKEGSLEDRINSIEKGTVVFSAHGHDEKLNELAKNKNLKIIDTTCPKVKYTMDKIKNDLKENKSIIYIGIKNHPESNAVLSLSNEIIFIDFIDKKYPKIRLKSAKVYNQTTLSIFELKKIHDDLNEIYDDLYFENDICLATTKRQLALLDINEEISYILIIGDSTSSNTMRLYEICKKKYINKIILFASTLDDIKKIKIDNTKNIFITAGASTPDIIINPIIEYLENL